jgi:hypothetical protein
MGGGASIFFARVEFDFSGLILFVRGSGLFSSAGDLRCYSDANSNQKALASPWRLLTPENTG